MQTEAASGYHPILCGPAGYPADQRALLCSCDFHPCCKQVGIIQTAYANGASSQYIREQLRLETVVTPTGVKHLHAAAERFDIGIYFEANGHGTVLFRPALIERLHKVRADSSECSAAVCRDCGF